MTLTSEQRLAVLNGQPVSINVFGAECVVLRKDVYLKLDAEFDSNPMSNLEMDLLADKVDEIISRAESQ